MPLLALPWIFAALGLGTAGGAIATHAAGEAAEDSAKPFGAIWLGGIFTFAAVGFWLWRKIGKSD